VAGTNAIKIGASDPDFIKVRDNGSSSAGVYSYAFDADTEEQLFFTIQLPHSYKAGTDISPHIHWMPTTTGTNAVVWGLEYTWSNIDGTYGNTTLITATDAADGTAYKHQLADFADISGSGKNESSMLLCRIYRKAADAADTFTGDAVFLEVDFHFQMNKLGSDNEIPD
jgi:hypothetical protein